MDDSIWHIEFQSSNDPEMPWRMYQYKALLLMYYRNENGDFPIVRQRVYYTGNGAPNMPDKFQVPGTGVIFEVVDLKGQFDNGRDLLDSDAPMDRVLGLLCMRRPHDDVGRREYLRAWQRVANTLNRENTSAQMDARTLFEFAADIRNVDLRKIRGWPEMPITANLENTILAKQLYNKGVSYGEDIGRRSVYEEDIIGNVEAKGQRWKPQNDARLKDLSQEELKRVRDMSRSGITFDAAYSRIEAERNRRRDDENIL
ncbi:hypothetical protein HL658_12410 [Azospirillum sp. RWY-5-1]|uniref:Rpn family recombination-promoting nuclease/putative transposase n=1 Tax=Azospirillum oleiclasticum TaxID=2735135 RepID=A0ABX2T8W1_9PROT|nr:hypothetical protein [Azospirillum oleiclasticum]NYZ13356.1 hypothetical protein [Azospirillum oleiclasticum]NYZ20517.1 hypothetical protein [Azospirillum oleiclasticum]